MKFDEMGIPPGFKPLLRPSPFLNEAGPFYVRQEENGLIIGLRILEKHTNSRGIAHGGLLLTLADIALGRNIAFLADPPLSLMTASLSADFAASAKLGDWVEARVDVQKIGRRLAFANVYLWVGSERIMRASGLFSAAPLDAAPR